MNSLEVIRNIYKPYRYTKKGKSTIIYTTSGDYVIKENNKDVKSLFNYLKSRNFSSYPNIIDSNRKDIMVYEYLDDTEMPKEQKGLDMINVVSNLHNKTTHFKEISEDKYKTIYENVDSNLNYLYEYYNDLYDKYFKEVFHSPSHFLFMQNYYKIIEMINFSKKELNDWYDISKNENTQRVCLVHNNLSLDHFIKSDREILISWDNFKIDTPVLDLVKFYQNNYLDINFKAILNQYNNHYPLNDNEKKLFFILVSIPPKIEMDKQTEINLIKEIRIVLDYIYKTEELVRPYYSKEEEK